MSFGVKHERLVPALPPLSSAAASMDGPRAARLMHAFVPVEDVPFQEVVGEQERAGNPLWVGHDRGKRQSRM